MSNWFTELFEPATDTPRIVRVADFTPKEDITAFEMAKCFEIYIGLHKIWDTKENRDAKKNFILSYPENIKRHFKVY